MEPEKEYIRINRDSWNRRVAHHLRSSFYNLEAFLAGQSSLQEIELGLLPDLKDKRVLHLQCHFGQDSIALARMGATVIGVDFSEIAIEAARELAEKTQTDHQVSFLCCDLYDLPQYLITEQLESFDMVFTTYGTIGWLPDLDRWAQMIKQVLKPGGELLFVEFHPVIWMFDNALKEITYSYFKRDPIVESSEGTYADAQAPIRLDTVTWNHSLSEVLGALLSQRLQVRHFQEYDYSPYNIFEGGEAVGPNRYRVKQHADRLPLVYSLIVQKQEINSN